MVNYGYYEICLDDVLNEAFVDFSYEQDNDLSVKELFIQLIEYGLVKLGYLDVH